MKRLPLVVFGTIAILLSSTISYSFAETAPYYVKQWGSQGLQTLGFFSLPQDLAVDSEGNIYVTDYGNRRIQKFDNDGNFLHTWGIKGSDNGQFQFPVGITIGGDFVYVVDNELNRVQKFDTIGKYITQWGGKGSETGKFLMPQGIAVDSKGDVYVADTGNNRIQKFSSDGKFLLSWGISGLGNGEFLNPRGVATDSQGSVYVSDSGNNRIQKFTTDGVFIRLFDASSGSSLRFPQGLSVDSSGNIYVADAGNQRIVKIDRDGKPLSSWGSLGQTNGNFNNPKDVVTDSVQNVFVVDTSNHRIQKFAPSTSTQTETVIVKPVSNDKTNPVISAPSDITTEANGILSTVLIGQATATDANGIASIVNNAPAKFPLGTTMVTWTATDTAGNIAKATQAVTVVDTTSPVISAPPPVTVEATGPEGTMADLGTPATSDVIGVESITNDAPSSFPIGDTIVTWTATDAAGNSATTKQVVTVQDTARPKITAPADIVSEATSVTENTVTLGDATAIDNGIIESITNDAPESFPIGTTTVTWVATDAAGNSATDTQQVKITDTTAPTIIVPADVVFEATSSSGNIVPLGNANATDVQFVSIANDAPQAFPLGETMITWNATDIEGHSSIATQKVTVLDTTKPTLLVPADIVAEATSSDHNIVSIGQATAEDIIGVSSITNNAPAEFSFGQTTVTWAAVDTSGNSVSANQTITIIDTTAPQLQVPKNVVAEATDPTINIIDIGNAQTSDIIGVASVTNDAPETFPIGMTTITWIAKDTSGNSVNATQTITIQDTTNPVLTVPADITVEAATSSDNIVSIGNANATDITGIQSITNDAPATFPVGDTIVTWTVLDNFGNSAIATQKVTVVDTTSPTIVAPEDVTSEALAPVGNVIPIGDATADDLVGVVSITNNAPASFSLGDTIITWTATDAAGNSAIATQKVTVVDTTSPTIVAPEAIESEATSATENLVVLGNATAADFVGIQSITNDAPATFQVGETVVTWTAIDNSGLAATATQLVTIHDTTPPILKVPETITVEATDKSENIVNIGQAKASDLVGIQSITNDAPDAFPIGLTTVTWTVTDVSGLSYSATQKINVVDTTSPTLSVPQDIVIEADSAANNTVELGDATASDVLEITSITSDAPASFPIGDTIVTWTATDAAGNSATATQKVTVVDTTSPTIVAPEDVTSEALAPVGNVIPIGDATADDLVGVVSITNNAPASFSLGDTIITWTATDAAGNSAIATQKVTVVDTTSPTIVAPEDVTSEATDPLQNFVILGNANSTDTVGVISITNDAPSVFSFGETTVTWTATDAAGNSATDTQIITIVDTTAPKITAPADVKSEATSPTSNAVAIGTATAKDIMGVTSLTNDAPSVFSFGETIVTWTATDNSGNSATSTQKVTIIDTIAPTIIVPSNIVIDAVSLETPVQVGTATATDVIDLAPKITNDAPASFSLGETVITWTATDQFGNSANFTQTVTVQTCGKPSSSYNLIIGGPSDDTLAGTSLADLIFGLAGNDIITGEEGNDCIIAGDGDDIIFGNDGEDTIAADAGNDIVRGGSGEDKINGNSGFDIIDGGDDHDACNVGENASEDLVTKCEAGQL